jgi:RimJ/RimL family protein N-acetyltransferase
MPPISFKPLSDSDLPRLHQWMQEKHVSSWWEEGTWSFKDLKEKYRTYALGYKMDQGKKKEVLAFIIELQKRPIGYIQMYNALDFTREDFDPKEFWPDPLSSIGALDFYIGEPDCLGRGLGVEILQTFLAKHLFQHFNACLVDPDKKNTAAINAYTKAGFTMFQETESHIIMIATKLD